MTNVFPNCLLEGFLADFSRNEMRNATLLSDGDDDWETPAGISMRACSLLF